MRVEQFGWVKKMILNERQADREMAIKKAQGRNGLIYVGSYGDKSGPTLHVCSIDKETGELKLLQQLTGVEQASYLAVHPDGKRLYAVKEVAEADGVPGGAVVALTISEEDGLLGEVAGSASTGGAHPCYVSVAAGGKALLVANYTGGNLALVPLTSGGEIGDGGTFFQHTGELGPVANRQGAPHAHCIAPLPGKPFVYAVDLGLDAVVAYRFDEESIALEEQYRCKVPGGAGPRHIVFHPSIDSAYVTNELDSSVTQLAVDRVSGELRVVATYSSLPSDYEGYNDSADLHLSPDGRFLYSSNRGHNSIAVFAVAESGALQTVQHMGCGGEQPRNFGITPDGRFLLAANQKSGTIVVFGRDAETGVLSPTGRSLELPSPVCIRFA